MPQLAADYLPDPRPPHCRETRNYIIVIVMAQAVSTNVQAHPVMLPSDCPSKILRDEHGSIVAVPTKMNYVSSNTTEVHVHRDLAGDDHGTEFNQEADGWTPTEVMIHNARLVAMTLERNGFEIREHVCPPVDFLDSQQVLDVYYPSCEGILKEYYGPGNVEVRAFDHNIRINQPTNKELKGAGTAKTQPPLGMVHGDYSLDSGPRRLQDLGLPPKANDVWKDRLAQKSLLDPAMVEQALAGKRRFALINVWRNIDNDNPVQELPLACVDAMSASSSDLRHLYIHYADRLGENYFVVPSKSHRWYYFPAMTHNEAMLIKQWDSHGDLARGERDCDVDHATFSIHSAFVDPTTPTADTNRSSIPRKSIEVRCALIWNDEP